MMMYSRSMIMLTLVSTMIGLALPSSVMTQQKIAKGSKKNPPPSSQQEEIPVELRVPQAMPAGEVKERVTKVVNDILKENKRRLHSHKGPHKGPVLPDKAQSLVSVLINGMTKSDCSETYYKDSACYAAIIQIVSDGTYEAAISKLREKLDEVVEEYDILVTRIKKGFPDVELKNATPYPVTRRGARVDYTSDVFCRNDRIPQRIAPGDTWTFGYNDEEEEEGEDEDEDKETAPSRRGVCLVELIYAFLDLPDDRRLLRTQYRSRGTTESEFSILYFDGVCCVRSSNQDQDCLGNGYY